VGFDLVHEVLTLHLFRYSAPSLNVYLAKTRRYDDDTIAEVRVLQLTGENTQYMCFLREINSIAIAIFDRSLIEDSLYKQPEFHAAPLNATREIDFSKNHD
jgi:hypothetical protein